MDSPSYPYARPPYSPHHISHPHYVRILDTTLRDGEQAPGASLTSKQKLHIARHLAKLGVDVIETGFPISSPDELHATRLIAQEVGCTVDKSGHVPVICGFGRCKKEDIDAIWEGVKHAMRPRIRISIATSDIHMKHKLRKSPEEVIRTAKEMVTYARSLGCDDIQFGAEDAGRSSPLFLYSIFEEVIRAGATTISVPDTVGSLLPNEYGEIIAKIKANVPGADNVVIATHCHNDLGLATANTLAGGLAGARQLEVTVNGIGERAGNASLEEVVMAIKCRGQERMGGLFTGIQIKQITEASKLVAEYSGMAVQPHKAIVGAHAFEHSSGIHQDGMLKFKGTYEFLSPEDIGLTRTNTLGIVLGKHSGRHALKTRLQQIGYNLDPEALNEIFKRFKIVADKKKKILDADLEALLSDTSFEPQHQWSLIYVQVVSGTSGSVTATIKLRELNEIEHTSCSSGTDAVDAAFKAVNNIVKTPASVLEYSFSSKTEGHDTLISTRVVISSGKTLNGHIFSGTDTSGICVDIVESSVRAYLNAINRMIVSKGFK